MKLELLAESGDSFLLCKYIQHQKAKNFFSAPK